MKALLAAIVALVLGAPFAASAACPPAVALVGEAPLVARVATQLAIRGVGGPVAGCPALRASIARGDRALTIALTDRAGQRAVREVSDPAIAAAWIESWLHPEIDSPLIDLAILRPTLIAAPGLSESQPARRPIPWRAYLLGEQLSGSDDTTWRALQASTCARLGPLCLGAALRLADDRAATWIDGQTYDRLAVVGGPTVSLPFEIERIVLAPSVGLGLAWLKTELVSGSMPSCPNSFGCSSAAVTERQDVGLLIEVGASAELAVADRVRLVLAAGLAWAPGARHATASTPPSAVAGGGIGDDPASPGAGTAPPPDTTSPGSPDMGAPGAVLPDGTVIDPVADALFPGQAERFGRLAIGLVVDL